MLIGDEIKKEHDLDGTEEEVITSNIDCDFSDYMSEHKLTPTGIPGIDLSDPQQLASFAKLVVYCNVLQHSSQTFKWMRTVEKYVKIM